MKKMLSIGAVMMLAIMVLLAGWSVGAQPIQAAGQATGNAVGKRTKPEGQQKTSRTARTGAKGEWYCRAVCTTRADIK